MNWNPFKRIAALESTRQTQLAILNELTTMITTLAEITKDQTKRLNAASIALKEHDERLTSLQNQFLNRVAPQLSTPVTISRADVEKEAKARLKRAAYSRKYYANKRAEKAKAAAAGEAK